MAEFSSFKRDAIFKKIKEHKLDVLVIGGGITGAGITLDSVTRGMNTALIEMQDFASGTSSKSTKLVHGGLRYLKQFEIKMVAEVGKERETVYENGPHVTTPEWMMLPIYEGGTFSKFTTSIGLRIYDFLAGVKRGERRQMFKPEIASQKEPLIKQDGLKGAGYYVEYKTDDARLTIEVIKKAVEEGAHAINHAKVVDFIYNNSKVVGVVAEDQINGDIHEIYAKKIINAGGPWVDDLREMDGSKQGKTLYLTKGVHLVFSKESFPLQQAIYFDSPDGRMIFAIPRNDTTYVGTTDTAYQGNITHPTVTKEDCHYIIDAINCMFPSLNINSEDVESSWAGIRPLIAEDGKDPSEVSRKDEIFISDSGLISMAGGKLTGYRKMAEQAIDTVTKQLKEEVGILYSKSNTHHLPISGGDVEGSAGFKKFQALKVAKGTALGLEEEAASLLTNRYGSNVDIVYRLYQDRFSEATKESIDPVVFAQLIYGLEYELVYKPTDFFVLRTGGIFFAINWVQEHKDFVINYMARNLEWSEEQKERYTKELDEILKEKNLEKYNY